MSSPVAYNPATAQRIFRENRAATRDSRHHANEALLHDLSAIGMVEFFEGPGDNPTGLSGYSPDKLWLRQSAGVQASPGTVRRWNGETETALSSWPVMTREWWAEYLDGGQFPALTLGTEAQNDAMFTALAVDYEGAIIDLGNRTFPVNAIPGSCRFHNGSFLVAGTLHPLPREPLYHPMQGNPRIITQNTGINEWPLGLWYDASETRVWQARVVSNGHDVKSGSRLNVTYSEDSSVFIGKRTVYSDSDWNIKNSTMLGQMGSGRVGGIVSIFDGTNNDHLFIYSDNNGAAWSTTALALGSDPFPHGGLHPWPAIAGGHDTTGFMFPCYIGSAIGFLRTPDNGTAWAVVTISPGGSLPNGYAVEPAMVRTPHGYIIFARTSVTNGVAGNIYATTAPLDMSSWSDWVDTGIPLSNNVPNAIYDSGNVYVYATYRENAGTAVPDVQENTMRVYIQKAKLCFDNGGAMPTAYSVAGRYPKSSTGYIHSMKFPSGDWFHHFKVGEDILSSTVPANGQICAITTASTPALGFGVEEGPVANLLRNWHFSHWPLGDTFTGVTVTGTETAYAWQTANGNAPATMSVTRALIDEEQSRQFSHRPLYGLKIDTTAVPDDFTGIRQIIYGEEARRMIMAMTGRGLVTAVLQGVGSPLPLARVAITLDYGVGGTTDTIVSASFPTVYALNDGAWEAEVELAIANTSAAIVWGSNPQLRTQFDCDSTATGWIATLVGAGLFPGRAPEMRMIGPIEAGQIAATQGRLVLANGANNNVVLPLAGIIRISGPTGAFSITGIEHDPEMQGLVTIHNATSQDMTIAHNSGSSISTNRINCLTGADIVLTGTSSVTLYYSPSDSLWQVVATNG